MFYANFQYLVFFHTWLYRQIMVCAKTSIESKHPALMRGLFLKQCMSEHSLLHHQNIQKTHIESKQGDASKEKLDGVYLF